MSLHVGSQCPVSILGLSYATDSALIAVICSRGNKVCEVEHNTKSLSIIHTPLTHVFIIQSNRWNKKREKRGSIVSYCNKFEAHCLILKCFFIHDIIRFLDILWRSRSVFHKGRVRTRSGYCVCVCSGFCTRIRFHGVEIQAADKQCRNQMTDYLDKRCVMC